MIPFVHSYGGHLDSVCLSDVDSHYVNSGGNSRAVNTLGRIYTDFDELDDADYHTNPSKRVTVARLKTQPATTYY